MPFMLPGRSRRCWNAESLNPKTLKPQNPKTLNPNNRAESHLGSPTDLIPVSRLQHDWAHAVPAWYTLAPQGTN